MTTYDTPEAFRAAWRTAKRAAKRPKRPRKEPAAPTTTTRKPGPVERIAAAGYMISVERDGRHWFENKDGERTPAGDDDRAARRLALAWIGET